MGVYAPHRRYCRGQLSEALPGAVSIFADALFGGDEAKLFKAMEKGQVGMEELVKVIDHMKTLSREDLIAKMLESPERKLNKLKNSWARFLMEINKSGMLDVMSQTLEKLADGIQEMGNWVKENKTEISEWITRIKEVVSVLWEYKEVLLGIYLINKLLMAQRGISLLSWLLTPAALPPAPLAARIKNFLKGALNIVKRAWPVMAAAFIVELIDTLQGDATWLGAMTQSDNPIYKWLSRMLVTAGKLISTTGVIAIGLADLIVFDQDFDIFLSNMKQNFADLGAFLKANFGELVPDVMSVGIERTIKMFSIFFGWLKTNVLASATGLGKLARMDFSGAGEAFGGTVGFTDYVKSQLPQLPPQPQMLPPVQQSLNYRPRANNSATPVVSAPVVNLTVNASGTAEEMAKMASKTVTDMITSTILGSMANYQSGAK